MILSCPSCGTRYRHQAAPAELARQARCSQCDHRFPLGEAPRTYLLLPSRATAGASLGAPVGAMRIGMDDPSLAPQLGATVLDADGAAPAAMGYTSVAEPSAADLSPAEADPLLHGADGHTQTGLAAEAREVGSTAPGETTAGAGRTDSAHTAADPAGTRLVHPVREFLISMMLAAAGTAAGYYGSVELGFDPYRWAPAGTAVGLLLGLVWVRWAAPKR